MQIIQKHKIIVCYEQRGQNLVIAFIDGRWMVYRKLNIRISDYMHDGIW